MLAMRRSIWLFCLLLSISAVPLRAQNRGVIQGRVLDTASKRPLIGTNVIVVGANAGAATDLEGRFIIENLPVGTYVLQFSYLGYKSISKPDIVVRAAGPTTVNVELEEDVVEGGSVTVTLGYFEEEEQVAPSTIGLSQEEIRRFPGGFEDVVRTVSTLPGVAINMTAGRNDLLVRGGGPSENLYLINNIEVPNINHFGTPGFTGGSLSFVNLDFVEDVSFSTGGFGARYGDKMSSVVALTMRQDRPKGFETKATISATQYGIDAEAQLGGRGGFALSARKSYLDLIFKAAGLPFVPVYTDYNVLLNYELSPKDRIFLIGLSAVNNVDRNQSSLENRVFNAGVLDNTQYKGIGGLNYQRILPWGYVDLSLSVNLTRFSLSQIDENQEEYFSSDVDEWEYGIKLLHQWLTGKRLNILTGISSKFVRNNNQSVFADTIIDRNGNRVPLVAVGLPERISVDETVGKYAAFVEFDWIVGPLFQINAGLRADYYGFIDDSFYLAPRLSLKYRLDSKNSIRLSGGIYYQSPSYIWVTNPLNSRLRALQNRMGVLGWDYLIREDLRLSVEGYYKRYSDLPTGTVPGVNDYVVLSNAGTSYGGREDDFQSFGFFELVSNGKGKSFGVEFLLQKKFSEIPLYGQLSLTLNKSEFEAGNGLAYPGIFDQRVILNVSGGYIFNEKWEVAAKFRLFSGVPYIPIYRPSENPVTPGVTQNLPEEYLSERLDLGHHMDIRVDRIFNFRTATLIVYVDIQNVYNYRVPMRPTYDFWTDEIVDRSEIAILPSVGMSLEF